MLRNVVLKLEFNMNTANFISAGHCKQYNEEQLLNSALMIFMDTWNILIVVIISR